jgi:hypothetical protein
VIENHTAIVVQCSFGGYCISNTAAAIEDMERNLMPWYDIFNSTIQFLYLSVEKPKYDSIPDQVDLHL